jgi:hydroxymethylpyrimidine/phosphomethylpyrimidine kinase
VELIDRLLPLAYVVTPNLGEAEVLTGLSIRSVEEMEQAARRIHSKGSRHVVVKGGHLAGPPVDVLFDGQHFQYFAGERIETKSLHGTGCTFASAIAAELAKGAEVSEAVRQAKAYVTTAIRLAEPIGHGFGPTHHLGALYRQAARYEIISQLQDAVAELRGRGIAALIPEVQANFGLALSQARTPMEVAAWEGRIVRLGTDIQPVGNLRFGASRHVATMILTIMRVDPRYRSAMNIRYGEDILRACQAANLRSTQLPRQDEPWAALQPDEVPATGRLAEPIRRLEAMPDVVYDPETMGQEAMVWVLGQEAAEVSRKVLRIRSALLGL